MSTENLRMATARTLGHIVVAGRTLSVRPDAPNSIDPQPGQLLWKKGPYVRNVHTECDIIGALATPEGAYSQVHRHSNGTFFVHGWVAASRYPQAEYYSTPEEAVSATLTDYYSNRYAPAAQE